MSRKFWGTAAESNALNVVELMSWNRSEKLIKKSIKLIKKIRIFTSTRRSINAFSSAQIEESADVVGDSGELLRHDRHESSDPFPEESLEMGEEDMGLL